MLEECSHTDLVVHTGRLCLVHTGRQRLVHIGRQRLVHIGRQRLVHTRAVNDTFESVILESRSAVSTFRVIL